MKKMMTLLSLVVTATSFANLITLDPRDVDSLVLANGNEIYIQDIQDGLTSLRGVYADDDKLVINTTKLNGVRSIRMGAVEMAMGGDMGGGGMR